MAQPTPSFDFKLVFFDSNPASIGQNAQILLQKALDDKEFCMQNGEPLLCIVGAQIFDKEEEPRLEFYLVIDKEYRERLCMVFMSMLMDRLNKLDSQLWYSLIVPAVSAGQVTMAPFAGHLSNLDQAECGLLVFANVLWHNLLFVHHAIGVPTRDIEQFYKWQMEQRVAFENELRRGSRRSTAPRGHCPQHYSSTLRTSRKGLVATERTGSPDLDGIVPRERTPSPSPMDGLGKLGGIRADFEHDRRQLTLTFMALFKDKASKEEKCIDQIRMTVRYESVVQVMAQIEDDNEKNVRLSLLLRLRNPPEVRLVKDVFGFCLTDEESQDHRRRSSAESGMPPRDRRGTAGERVLGWGPQKEALQENIANSPVLLLNFVGHDHEKMSKLLGRFMGILKMKLELRNFTSNEIETKIKMNALDGALYRDQDLCYWLEALATRGNVVQDHWRDWDERDYFFNSVIDRYREMRETTLRALETLTDRMLGREEIRHELGLTGLFLQLERAQWGMDPAEWSLVETEGYERVRKVVITPSRVLLCGNELLMGNRVLRLDKSRYPPDKFLRVIFRDENMVRVLPSVGDKLIDKFVFTKLNNGFQICGKDYYFVGTSNSQMRDGGCYFLQASCLNEVYEFRRELGEFQLVPSIPKMMSRLGLCFTQGRETSLNMELQMQGYDFAGGQNKHGQPYIFSDGCGCLSMEAARRIASEINLDPANPPSCFQFRYAGYKGVLVVNPNLDRANAFWNKLEPSRREGLSREDCAAVHFYFRPSQKKFDIRPENVCKCKLEVVKFSGSSPICLNRPFINIIDQVSRKQSHLSHNRICSRINMLLDQHIFAICSTLTDEYAARRRLQELPRLVEYGRLQTVQFTRDPFFRMVLRSAATVSISKLRQKLSIAVPHEMGRVMFGVVDETGILQYGQVFAQYSARIDHQNGGGWGGPNKAYWRGRPRNVAGGRGRTLTLTGPVLITKNPAIVEGDVRMFQAIDVPALRHLVDVVVFPRWGPRPHPDEMAGSDLDGDEYVLIWDPELALDHNEPAADYSPAKELDTTEQSTVTDFQEKMADFFVNYMKHDSIGRIANSHLANSDLYGISAEVCSSIARKHQHAVDFPKTGKNPPPLTIGWSDDIPPERYERAPDFMEKEGTEPQYQSSRLNGQLFRRIKELSNFIAGTIFDEAKLLPESEEWLLSKENHEEYIDLAQKHYNIYEYSIKRLMDAYGIGCEGELFSSSYSSLRNRFSDREADDMSFFTTQRVIEQRLWAIAAQTRETFFAAFGGRMDQLTVEGVCEQPTEQLKLLARAYYTIAYFSSNRNLLSFPWVASWDVLDSVRRLFMTERTVRPFSADPFGDRLTQHIDHFVRHTDKNALAQFRARMFTADDQMPWKELLRRYALRHRGLADLMFFAVEWARLQHLFVNSPLREEHICLLLLSYGLMNLPQSSLLSDDRRPWLSETPPDWTPENSANCPVQDISRVGRRFSTFIEGLASRHFDQMPRLDFEHLGLKSGQAGFFYNREWRPLYTIALRTYHHIVFTDRLDNVLPKALEWNGRQQVVLTNQPNKGSEELLEGAVFLIELPGIRHKMELFIEDERLIRKLCAETNCEHICLRRHPQHRFGQNGGMAFRRAERQMPRPMRVLVSSWGTRDALERLRQLTAVVPKLDLTVKRRQRIQILPEETRERLEGIVWGNEREREFVLEEMCGGSSSEGS